MCACIAIRLDTFNTSPKDTRSFHNLFKLILPNSTVYAFFPNPSIRFKDHILEHFFRNFLAQLFCNALQMRKCNDIAT